MSDSEGDAGKRDTLADSLSEGDAVVLDGERHRVEKTNADGRVISLRRVEDADPSESLDDPGVLPMAKIVLGLGALIAIVGLTNGDASGVLAFLAGAVVIGLMYAYRVAVSRTRGDGDD